MDVKYCFSNQNALKQIIPACGIILNQCFSVVNHWFSVVNRWFRIVNQWFSIKFSREFNLLQLFNVFYFNDNINNKDRSTSGRLHGKNYLLQPLVASGSGYCGWIP